MTTNIQKATPPEEKKYKKCWACGSLCLDNVKHYKRVEEHHIMGKAHSVETLPLCLICHDLVDRMPLKDIKVFSEFLTNVMEEFKLIEDRDCKYLKLLFLKCAKLYFENQIKEK